MPAATHAAPGRLHTVSLRITSAQNTALERIARAAGVGKSEILRRGLGRSIELYGRAETNLQSSRNGDLFPPVGHAGGGTPTGVSLGPWAHEIAGGPRRRGNSDRRVAPDGPGWPAAWIPARWDAPPVQPVAPLLAPRPAVYTWEELAPLNHTVQLRVLLLHELQVFLDRLLSVMPIPSSNILYRPIVNQIRLLKDHLTVLRRGAVTLGADLLTLQTWKDHANIVCEIGSRLGASWPSRQAENRRFRASAGLTLTRLTGELPPARPAEPSPLVSVYAWGHLVSLDGTSILCNFLVTELYAARAMYVSAPRPALPNRPDFAQLLREEITRIDSQVARLSLPNSASRNQFVAISVLRTMCENCRRIAEYGGFVIPADRSQSAVIARAAALIGCPTQSSDGD